MTANHAAALLIAIPATLRIVPQKAPAAPLWKARGSARKIFDNLEEALRRFPIQAGIIAMAYFGASTWACDGLSHKFARGR